MSSGGDHERALFSALAGRVCELVGNFDGAHQWQLSARAYAITFEDADVHAEIAWYGALSAWSNRDLARASQELETVRKANSRLLQIRAYDLMGIIAAFEGCYDDQVAAYETALVQLSEPNVAKDRWFEGHILRQLALGASHLGSMSVIEYCAARYDAFPWTPDQDRVQFHTAKAIASAYGMQGSHLRAFAYYRDACRHAGNLAQQVHAFAARARQAAFCSNDLFFAQDQIAIAKDFFERCDWRNTTHDDRQAINEYILALAELDAPAALQLHEKMRDLAPSPSTAQFSADDLRNFAHYAYVEGLVLARNGRTSEALDKLQRSFAIFNERKLEGLDVFPATELYCLGQRTAEVEKTVSRILTQVPGSYLASRIRTHK